MTADDVPPPAGHAADPTREAEPEPAGAPGAPGATPRRRRHGRGALALAGLAGAMAGAVAGASVVVAVGAGDDGPGCDEAAESALDGYGYDRSLVVALGHAIADGHPDLEELASAVHRAEAGEREPGRGEPAPGIAGAAPGDVAVDYLSALAALAERPELATDEVVGALTDAATASPDLNAVAAGGSGDGRARGVVAVSALVRRSEPYSPTTETPELTALINDVASAERAVERSGMHPQAEDECHTARRGG